VLLSGGVYEKHSQERAALNTDASVKAVLARDSCTHVKGVATSGESSQFKKFALEAI
jgi:hypothetical protein